MLIEELMRQKMKKYFKEVFSERTTGFNVFRFDVRIREFEAKEFKKEVDGIHSGEVVV